MEQELKYPVKYAVEELSQYGGWENSFVDTIKGYIVSKCYVVESNIKYYADGKEDITYNVVFPYKDIETFQKSIERGLEEKNLGNRAYPRFDTYGNYYPITKVKKIYDTYEEANQEAKEKNEKLRNDIYNPQYSKMPDNEIINEIGRGLAITMLFEQQALEKTEDMIVDTESLKNIR